MQQRVKNMIIRKISMADVVGFHAALSKVASEKKYLATVQTPPVDGIKEFVKSNIESGNPQFVADDDGLIVGWADITRKSREHFDHVGELGMGVLSDCRGKGIGSQLLKATLNDAWEQGFEKVELDVYHDNLPAIALYKKFGFFEEGVRSKARLREGVYQDLVLMGIFPPS
jgi:ribosomal protein S18 acetylase RimI-like enzyme